VFGAVAAWTSRQTFHVCTALSCPFAVDCKRSHELGGLIADVSSDIEGYRRLDTMDSPARVARAWLVDKSPLLADGVDANLVEVLNIWPNN
jgi:hypothetical protein